MNWRIAMPPGSRHAKRYLDIEEMLAAALMFIPR